MIRLRISEIFFSLQGETKTVGMPTVFIRLTGCPLRCQYCDTAYAFRGGRLITLTEIKDTVKSFKTRYVTVTGGEPLAQLGVIDLLEWLCDAGYVVSLETSGALDISQVDRRVIKVVDIKTPGSDEVSQNDFNNFKWINAQDQIKFVICDRGDYDWAKALMHQYQLDQCCEILFSPSYQQLSEETLADWILADQLSVRFQVQLHKHIWGDVPGK